MTTMTNTRRFESHAAQNTDDEQRQFPFSEERRPNVGRENVLRVAYIASHAHNRRPPSSFPRRYLFIFHTASAGFMTIFRDESARDAITQQRRTQSFEMAAKIARRAKTAVSVRIRA